MQKVMMLLVMVGGLIACGESEETKVMPVEETVFSDQVEALDKAKAVGQQLEEALHKQHQAMDDQ